MSKDNVKDAQNKAVSKKLVTSINCTTFSDIEPQDVDWLWYERIAIGKVTVIAGDPGLGKSLMTAALAAHISTGSAWPVDHATCPVGDVLIMSAEDDPDDTIRPRLDAAGADVAHVHYIGLVNDFQQDGTAYQRGFDLDNDLDLISRLVKEHPNTRLVIIDPVSAYLGRTDSHNNAQMRGLLAPLSAFATENGIAIVCVTHLNKGSGTNAMHRITGSLALVAAARASYLVTKDTDDPKRRLMLPMKNNLGDDQHGFAYSIAVADNGAPYILWEEGPVEVSADDALNNVEETEEDTTALGEAKEWILAQLESGAVPSEEMLSKAKKDGIAIKTLRRAKTDLKIESTRKNGYWSWIAPEGTYKENSKMANNCAHSDGHLTPLAENCINTEGSDSQDSQDGKDGHMASAEKRKHISGRELHAQEWQKRQGDSNFTDQEFQPGE